MTLLSSTTRRAAATVAAGMTLAGATVAFSAPAQAASEATWDAIAFCESTNNWSINTGNGFYGGLQFTLSSWRAVGGTGMPHQASKAEQIKRAEILQDLQGWGAWPVCSAKLGLYGKDTAPDAVVGGSSASTKAPVSVERTSTVTPAPQAPAAPKAPVVEQSAPQAPAVEETAADSSSDEVETITVKAGDSLWKLAKKYEVAGGWKALYAANADVIDDPTLIYVGQELVLPQA